MRLILPLAAAILATGCLLDAHEPPGGQDPLPAEAPAAVARAEAASATAPRGPIVVVGGSSAALPGIALAAELFRAEDPDVTIKIVEGLGSGGGVKSLAAGDLDFSVASRGLKDAEKGYGLIETLYTTDAFVLFADRAAGVSSLTREQIVTLYAGGFSRWSQLGGNDLPVVVVSRDKDDSEMERLLELWPELDFDWSTSVRIVDSDPEKAEALRTNPGAVGFINAGLFGFERHDSVPIAAEELSYSPDVVKDGMYPITVRFHLISPELGEDTAARRFFDYLLSSAWQSRLAEAMGPR